MNATKLAKLAARAAACLVGLAPLAAHADGLDEPIPSFYQEAGFSPNQQYVNQHPSEHIDPFSGKLKLSYVDLFIPGNGGMDIKIERSYHSVAESPEEPSAYGVGWTMNPARVLRKATIAMCDFGRGPLEAPVLELADGSRQILYTSLSGDSYITTNLWAATCDGGLLTVYSPDGTRYRLDVPGPVVGSSPTKYQATYYASQVTDRNGNTLSFSYSNFGTHMGISGITASDGRSVGFTYAGGGLKSINDGSRTWNYTCDPVQGWGDSYCNLTQVTRPDGASWRYEYNGSSPSLTPGGYSINKVTYPTGGTVSYSYDYVYFSTSPDIPRSTVVATKTASDGTDTHTWTYRYAPARQPCEIVNGGCPYAITGGDIPYLDRTTISGPEGDRIYYHFGYGSASPGVIYAIGTLSGVVDVNTQITGYGYTHQTISRQQNVRPGDLIGDALVHRPLVTQKVLNRNGQEYKTTFNGFDDFGNPTSITEQGTHTRQITRTYFVNTGIWLIGQVKDETILPDGVDPAPTITRTFDANGNKLTESRNVVTTSFTYTSQGDLATKTDARGNTIAYADYFRGIPRRENHPEDVIVTRTVDPAGNVESHTDGEGATTTYGHDGLNRLTSIRHPLGNPVSVGWSPNSRTVTRGAYTETVTFDGFGRDKQIRHADAATGQTVVQNYLYDALGRRSFASYPNSSVGTGFEYDIVGQPYVVYHVYDPGNGTYQGGHSYFYANNTVRLTNERGFEYLHTYRAYGDADRRDLMQVGSPEPGTGITMTRNALGALKEVTQGAFTRSYTYDEHYFLASKTDPELGTTTFARDEVGNLTSRRVGNTPAVQFGYDGLSRLTSITYASAPGVTKTYYKDDKLKTVDNGVARRAYVYDANKNLTAETLTVDGRTFAVGYGYDGNDALSALTYGSGSTIQYAPDAFGRPTQVAPYVTALSRHPTGQISSMTSGNGQLTTYGFNARNWPNRITIRKPGNADTVDSTYVYDGLGNVWSISDAAWNYYDRAMAYDRIDRLTTINGPWLGTTNGTASYDAVGNITQIALGASSTSYAYDEATNLLRTVSGPKSATYSYDGYGNVISDGTSTFSYDDASTLRCAKCGTPDEAVYVYDGQRTRVKVLKGGATTYFMHDSGGRLLWEVTPGANGTEYFYLAGRQVATRPFGSAGQ